MAERRKLIATLAVMVATAIHAQPSVAFSPQSLPASADDSQPDDIVVEGYRDRTGVDRRTTPPSAVSTLRNRRTYEYSERMAKCAARGHLSRPDQLSAVVDGQFNTVTHDLAQDRLVRINITCSESPTLASMTAPPASDAQKGLAQQGRVYGGLLGQTDAAPLGHSIYDRGAFTVQAIKMYAPDLHLTPAQVNDPAVQARFNQREIARNRFRLPVDYHYFEVAVCMVRLQPALAVRLATSNGSARFGDVQEALLDRARDCVGGAQHVSVDPTQFRLYIADAVYRWAVAVRGTDSLIPFG